MGFRDSLCPSKETRRTEVPPAHARTRFASGSFRRSILKLPARSQPARLAKPTLASRWQRHCLYSQDDECHPRHNRLCLGLPLLDAIVLVNVSVRGGDHAASANRFLAVCGDAFGGFARDATNIGRWIAGILRHVVEALQHHLPGRPGEVRRRLCKQVQRVSFVRLLLFQYARASMPGQQQGRYCDR
jgi:hypothetical protein